jgi:hypothetical protein
MIQIRDEQLESYFRELINNFFGLKYLNSLSRIHGKNFKFFVSDSWKKFRDGKFGSGINIPDPQHYLPV